MAENRFEVGDLVRHRASGQKAVIIECEMSCKEHRGLNVLNCKPSCVKELTGFYSISIDFDSKLFNVDGTILEKCNSED